jgi:hypothetical protein
MAQLERRKGGKLQENASYSRKIMVMVEQEGTHLWTIAILIHGDLQLQLLISSHLDDVVDSVLDLLGR